MRKAPENGAFRSFSALIRDELSMSFPVAAGLIGSVDESDWRDGDA
jgi:hypothetical protein